MENHRYYALDQALAHIPPWAQSEDEKLGIQRWNTEEDRRKPLPVLYTTDCNVDASQRSENRVCFRFLFRTPDISTTTDNKSILWNRSPTKLTGSIQHAGSRLCLGTQLAVILDPFSAAVIHRQSGHVTTPIPAALSAGKVAADGDLTVLDAGQAVAARRV